MKKAISTPNQGPRSKIMSEKYRGQKYRVSVPLTLRLKPTFYLAQLKDKSAFTRLISKKKHIHLAQL